MVGESPENCSWHLRRLAKYGFVEETGGGAGRNRPWRPASHVLTRGDSDETGEVAAAGDQLSTMLYEQEFGALRDWQAWRRTDPAAWQDAANFAQSVEWLTVEEPAELNEALTRLVMRGASSARTRPHGRPGHAGSGSSPGPCPRRRSRPNPPRKARTRDACRAAGAGLPVALIRPRREHGRRRADGVRVRHLDQGPDRLQRRHRAGHVSSRGSPARAACRGAGRARRDDAAGRRPSSR